MQTKVAVGAFLFEWTKFETQSVGMALRALSQDALFVEHTEKLLDLEARLKLLERMAFACGVAPDVIGDLEACLVRARKLHEHRDEVTRKMLGNDEVAKPVVRLGKPRMSRRSADFSRLAELETLWTPPLERVQEYTQEAIELQTVLGGITDRFAGTTRPTGAIGSMPLHAADQRRAAD